MTSALICALLVVPIQTAPLDQVMRELDTAMGNGELQDKSREAALAWLDGYANRVDMTTVTLAGARKITDSVLIYSPKMQDLLDKRLDVIPTANEMEKTLVTALRVKVIVNSPSYSLNEIAKLTETAVRSVGAKDLLATPDGSVLVSCVHYTLKAKSEGILQPFFKAIEGPVSTNTTLALLPLWTDYVTEDIKPDFSGRHAAVVGAVERAVQALKPTDEEQKLTLEDGLKQLKSRFAMGTLLNSDAPEIDFLWISTGDQKKLSDFKGRVVVVDFWATWCGPCVSSFPKIAELVKHYEGKPVTVLGVTSLQGMVVMESKTHEVATPEEEFKLMPGYIKEKKITWPVAFSKQDVFNPDYGVSGIPNIVIIDKKGMVRHIGLNPFSTPHEEKVKMIDRLLAE